MIEVITLRAIRVTNVEKTGLARVRHVFLEQHPLPLREQRQVAQQMSAGSRQPHAGAIAADVWLHNQGVVQAGSRHRGLGRPGIA